jgi:hypothetical protein
MRVYDAKTGVEVFGYTSIDVGNVDNMYWENGELIVTIATEGYAAQRIAIHPADGTCL